MKCTAKYGHRPGSKAAQECPACAPKSRDETSRADPAGPSLELSPPRSGPPLSPWPSPASVLAAPWALAEQSSSRTPKKDLVGPARVAAANVLTRFSLGVDCPDVVVNVAVAADYEPLDRSTNYSAYTVASWIATDPGAHADVSAARWRRLSMQTEDVLRYDLWYYDSPLEAVEAVHAYAEARGGDIVKTLCQSGVRAQIAPMLARDILLGRLGIDAGNAGALELLGIPERFDATTDLTAWETLTRSSPQVRLALGLYPPAVDGER